MTLSVNTNQAALVALQNLNKTSGVLEAAQDRISTGLRVKNAKDNAAVWSIAQDQRADIGALGAVKMSLDRATAVSQVTMTAGESISDILVQMKEKVIAALDPSMDTASRAALNSDYKALLRQINQVVSSATFDGANVLNGSMATDIRFLASADAGSFVTLSVKNMSLGGSIISIAANSTISNVAAANTVMTALTSSLAAVNAALGDIGAQARQIEQHNVFVSKLADVLEGGISNLVDADMAKEGAKLQALQVQQQLGAQALSIANESPQILLSLFRG
jgi:flagellin